MHTFSGDTNVKHNVCGIKCMYHGILELVLTWKLWVVCI